MHSVWFLSHLLAITVEQILVIVIAFVQKQLPVVLTPFLTFQLSSGMHCLTFSYEFLKCRVLSLCRFFLLVYTCTKNCK